MDCTLTLGTLTGSITPCTLTIPKSRIGNISNRDVNLLVVASTKGMCADVQAIQNKVIPAPIGILAPPPVWTKNTAPNLLWTSVASNSDGSKRVAVAENGGIYSSTNGGEWNPDTAPTLGAPTLGWRDVASSSDGSKRVAVVFGGGIYSSTNGGEWTQETSAPNLGWMSVASSSDGSKRVAVAYGGGIYSSTNGGEWKPDDAPNLGWTSVASSSDGSKRVAVVYGGGIYSL